MKRCVLSKKWVLTGLFFLLLAAVLPHSSHAQPTLAQPTSGGDGNFMSQQTEQTQNEAAAEKEDEDAAYKKSASVRAIGRMLRLSPEAASAVFEDFNFLLLAGIIVFYAAKLLPKVFTERQAKLDKQLLIARMATEEANERLIEVEERLGRLDVEIKELRTRAEQEGAADEERIKAAIEEERKKIVASAGQEIAAISATAERSLRKFAADLAIRRAASRLHLSEQEDRALVRGFSCDSQADLQGRRN